MSQSNYHYFLKITEHKSISKAAEVLYISQPSLTKYLQRLETAVGTTLVDRSKTPIKLTYAGEIFRDHILKQEAAERKLESMVNEINNSGRDKITLGIPLWRSTVLLPEFLPYFFKKYPLIQLQLVEGSALSIENAIMEDQVDIGMINLPVHYADISYEHIIEEHILLVGSHKNPLVQELLAGQDEERPIVDIHRFAKEPFILMKPGQHITGFVNNMLSQNNLELECRYRTGNVTTAINLAAADLGFTFVPELGTKSRHFPHDDAALFHVNNPPIHCALVAAYKKSSYVSQAAQLLISELQNFCQDFL